MPTTKGRRIVSDIATIATDQPETLTPDERDELGRLEAVIDRGILSFSETGSALVTIRDKRLHRETHETFETYCRDKWGVGSSRARQLISAARIVAELESVTIVTPTNEAQCRPLAGLTGDQAREVWELASESSGGQPTARDVELAKLFIMGPPNPALADDDCHDRIAEMEVGPLYTPTLIGMPVPAGPRRPIHDIIVKTADEARAQERADLLASLSAVRDTLSPECRERFDTDAYACRQSQDLLDELRKRYRTEYAIVGKGRPGQFIRLLALVFDCLDPSDWTACSACSGQGCVDCRELGYIVAKESKGVN